MSADWLNSPFERRSIQHGMRLLDEDGQKLGWVKAIGQTVVFVSKSLSNTSKGLWAVPLGHVKGISGKGVTVSGRGEAALEPAGDRWGTEMATAIHPMAEAAHGKA